MAGLATAAERAPVEDPAGAVPTAAEVSAAAVVRMQAAAQVEAGVLVVEAPPTAVGAEDRVQAVPVEAVQEEAAATAKNTLARLFVHPLANLH
jgi:hypothetical protein